MNHILKQKWRYAAALASIAALTLVARPAMAQETQTIKIGFSGPMTGAQARYGRDFQSGVQLALEEFNATKPVVDGKITTFILDTGDDQADPRTGTLVAQRLVDEGVKGMIGPFNSGVTIPASAIFSRAGIPEISMATAPAYTQQGFKTAFRMMTSDTQQGSVMGKYAVEHLHAKRIAIVDDRTAYGQGLAHEFELAAKAAGGQIIDHQYTSDQSTDFRSILTLLKTERPDMIYYAGADAQSAPLLKQARGLALRASFASGDMSMTDNFLQVAGKAAQGAFVSLPGVPLQTMPGGAAFTRHYKEKFNTDPGTYAPYAFDGAMALMKSMVAAGSSNPATYLPKLATIDMNGVTTKHFAYNQYGDLRDAVVTIYEAKDGKWVATSTITPK